MGRCSKKVSDPNSQARVPVEDNYGTLLNISQKQNPILIYF